MQCFFTQQTYVGHLWRLRDAATGARLAEYAGPAATLTLLPDGGLRVQPGLVPPPPPQAADPRWGVFRTRGAAHGLPILAYDCVCDAAVDAAEGILGRMLEGAPQHVLAGLAAGCAQVAIIGKDQVGGLVGAGAREAGAARCQVLGCAGAGAGQAGRQAGPAGARSVRLPSSPHAPLIAAPVRR